MSFRNTILLIRTDLYRLTDNTKWYIGMKYLICNASFKITFWFRLGNYLKTKKGIVFKILFYIVFLIHKHNQYLTGIQIPIGTSVGSGLCFGHYSCIVVSKGTQIGNNCTIFQGTTIGNVRGPKGGTPKIGNNVVIAAGAIIIGNVKIGNNVMVGAGAVVVNDIKDNSVVVGNPARVISENGIIKTSYYI